MKVVHILLAALLFASVWSTPSLCCAQAPRPADAQVESMVGVLMAHHREDLPESWPESAFPRLRWLAANHPLMLVRIRALAALRGDRSLATRTLALRILRDGRALLSLRLAAVIATEGRALDAEVRAALLSTRADPHMARAVARRMATPPPDAR